MVKQTKEEKKKMKPILGLSSIIVIPIIVAVTLAIIIFAAGVNVTDWVKEKGSTTPVISSFITTPEEENIQREEERMQVEMERKDTEIEELNQTVEDQESTIEQMEQEIVKLENNKADSNGTNKQELAEDEEEMDTVKTVSNSFKGMDKEQAALIIASLEVETAISILQEVSNDVRGEILEEMEPEAAASLTQLLIDSDN
ncbi:MotE family protein [Virgibacillus sp. CBA3643]|uniref:MotE family protein n=1 Tax=Virgibacillus sp. CBA3643 TaxID=2942278 RepID=UPI0035A2F0BE